MVYTKWMMGGLYSAIISYCKYKDPYSPASIMGWDKGFFFGGSIEHFTAGELTSWFMWLDPFRNGKMLLRSSMWVLPEILGIH